MSGTFIVLEGADGSGKSTMLAAAEAALVARGLTVCRVADPGHTSIGLRIREILLDPTHTEMNKMTELLLYVASRAQLVAEVIRPALERGEVVLADRFYISTLVYQGVGRWVPPETLRAIVRHGVDTCEPDGVILLTVPVATGMERVGGKRDRIEAKGVEYHAAVHAGYLAWAATQPPERVTVIDAARAETVVRAEVLAALDTMLARTNTQTVRE